MHVIIMNIPFLRTMLGLGSLVCGCVVGFGQTDQNQPPLEGNCGVRVVAVDAPVGIQPASGNFTIVQTFNANLPAAERAVIQQAINEWDALLQSRGVNPGNYPIAFAYGTPSSPSFLAETVTTFNQNGGALISATMVFDPNRTWFIDPSPADDAEFATIPLPNGFDMLTVARHELGHALGWTTTSRVTSLVANGAFDGGRLSIAVVENGAHADPTAHPNELMVPAIGTSTRRPIKLYPTAALLSRAYTYFIPMHFVDPAFDGWEIGAAFQPWRYLTTASPQSPGLPLLLAPATHPVPRNQTFSTFHRWDAARGGATIVAP